MDLQELRLQLREKEENLKQQRKNKITCIQYHGMTKKEAFDVVNLQIHQTNRLGIIQQFANLTRTKQDLFWSTSNSYIRYFNQRLAIDFKAKEHLQPIDRPCLIIINGNRKSKKKPILANYCANIFSMLDKRREDGNEILISVFGFMNQSMIDLLAINQDFENVLHRNLRIFKENDFVKTKNLIQIAVTNSEELLQIMNLYKSIKLLLEQQTKVKFKEIVFQFTKAELEDKKLIKFSDKCNILLLNNNNDAMQFHLKQCLGQLDRNEQLQKHNCKLTESLQDCFKPEYQIFYIGCMITDQELESQLSVIQFLDSVLPIKSKVTPKESSDTIRELLGSKYKLIE